MIYCVWYPSGGFGHFINAVLTLHGENFVRPVDKELKFSTTGDSHSMSLVAPKYFKDPTKYDFDFDSTRNYSVLIDNGINNEGKAFLNVFPDSTTIKLCYSDRAWPVIAKTMIIKAMKSTLIDELEFFEWGTTESWAQREKMFLFLRDHQLRNHWKADKNCTNIFIDELIEYSSTKSKLETSGIILQSFNDLWELYWQNNSKYFNPIILSQQVISDIKNKQKKSLLHITDIWTQAVIYYYIWLEFGIEVPHNDYKDFFRDTDQIRQEIL
jgi:hypothetical protein